MELQNNPPTPINEDSSSKAKSDTKSGQPTAQNIGFKPLKLIAKSKFSIYLASISPNLNTYGALKVFEYVQGQPNPSFLNESKYYWLDHPNIIKFYAIENKKINIHQGKQREVSYILMEYAPYSDFVDFVGDQSFSLDHRLVRTYFKQLISGLKYLHSNNLAHLDIKLENLLIGDDYSLKIADFDSMLESDTNIKGIHVGTENYRCPEIRSKQCQNPQKADIYAAGIVLFALAFKLMPFSEGDGLDKALNNGENQSIFWKNHPIIKDPQVQKNYGDLLDLLMRMLSYDPSKRPSCDEILDHKWLNRPVYDEQDVANIMYHGLKTAIDE